MHRLFLSKDTITWSDPDIAILWPQIEEEILISDMIVGKLLSEASVLNDNGKILITGAKGQLGKLLPYLSNPIY